MTTLKRKIELQVENFLPKSSNIAVRSTIQAMIIAFVSSIICYILFRNGLQPYHDIVVGNITLPGVYKNVDFYTYFTFAIVFIISFFAFNKLNYSKATSIENTQGKLSPFNYIIGFALTFVIMVLKMGIFPIFNLCFYAFIVLVAAYLYNTRMESENIVKLVCSLFFVYLSSAGVLAATSYYLPGVADRGTKYFVPLLWVLLCLESIVIYHISSGRFKGNTNIAVDIISAVTQVIIPLGLFGLINTRYVYKQNIYTPVQYGRFKNIVISIIAFLVIINIISIIIKLVRKRRVKSVFLTTLISFVSVCFWNTGYNLLINTDQFHTGETAVVYQQFIQLGQKWGSEFVSVLQGLGLSLSAVNEFIFGGTYATYSQAQNLVLLFAAVLTTVLIYPLIEQKWIILVLAPVMPLFYMNRIYFIAPVFLLLLNPKIIKSPIMWTYCYILTCIFHVWYQPTYGGAVAASLIPALIIIWYKELKNRNIYDLTKPSIKLKLGAFIISIIIAGILCLPMILNVLHFLKTNGYETMIANGLSALQTIKSEPNYFTGYTIIDMIIQFTYKFGSGLLAVVIMLYMLLTYVIKDKDNVKMIQGTILTISAGIAFFFVLPAIFTRIDPGVSRIGGTGFIFFGLLIPILLYLYRKDIRIKQVAIFVCGICLSVGFYVTFPPHLQIHQKVNSIVSVPDDAAFVKPEETGLRNLGYAFIQNEQYLHEAEVINEVCNYLLNDDQTYYDFTDKSIYYLLTNRKVPGLYVSSMVAANETLQNESIERLKKNDVPLVFINQPLRYMGVSESLRSYRIYRYFMQQNYRFISYKSCNFLVRSDIDLSPIQKDIEFIDLSNKIGLYDDQIAEETYNSSSLEELTLKDIINTNGIENSDISVMKINGADPYIVFKASGQTDFNKIGLLEINLKNRLSAGAAGQLFVQTDKVGHNENNSIHFDIRTKRILIPIYKYEQFKLDSKLITLRLDFDNMPNNSDVSVESIKLYNMSDAQKQELVRQYSKIMKNQTDNRLDDAFHQADLMQLPYQWGHSFKLMQERFLSKGTAEYDQKNIEVNNSQVKVHFKMAQDIPGSQGEFLRLKLEYSDGKKRGANLVISGIDKNGNSLSEEFRFDTASDNLFIPVGASPNCIQAKAITGFDLILDPDTKPYQIKIDDAQIYQLIK